MTCARCFPLPCDRCGGREDAGACDCPCCCKAWPLAEAAAVMRLSSALFSCAFCPRSWALSRSIALICSQSSFSCARFRSLKACCLEEYVSDEDRTPRERNTSFAFRGSRAGSLGQTSLQRNRTTTRCLAGAPHARAGVENTRVEDYTYAARFCARLFDRRCSSTVCITSRGIVPVAN